MENGISYNINGLFFFVECYAFKINHLQYNNDILLKDEARYI